MDDQVVIDLICGYLKSRNLEASLRCLQHERESLTSSSLSKKSQLEEIFDVKKLASLVQSDTKPTGKVREDDSKTEDDYWKAHKKSYSNGNGKDWDFLKKASDATFDEERIYFEPVDALQEEDEEDIVLIQKHKPQPNATDNVSTAVSKPLVIPRILEDVQFRSTRSMSVIHLLLRNEADLQYHQKVLHLLQAHRIQ